MCAIISIMMTHGWIGDDWPTNRWKLPLQRGSLSRSITTATLHTEVEFDPRMLKQQFPVLPRHHSATTLYSKIFVQKEQLLYIYGWNVKESWLLFKIIFLFWSAPYLPPPPQILTSQTYILYNNIFRALNHSWLLLIW